MERLYTRVNLRGPLQNLSFPQGTSSLSLILDRCYCIIFVFDCLFQLHLLISRFSGTTAVPASWLTSAVSTCSIASGFLHSRLTVSTSFLRFSLSLSSLSPPCFLTHFLSARQYLKQYFLFLPFHLSFSVFAGIITF